MNLGRFFRSMLRPLPDDALALQLHASLPAAPAGGGGARVLVQCVEDPYYLGLFAHVCAALRRHSPAISAELFVPRSFNVGVGTDWKLNLLRIFPLARVFANQWVRAYSIVARRVGYRSTSLRHPLGDLLDALRAWRAWSALRSTAELEALAVDGIVCGDLVIDSYLRFRPSPQVRLRDPFLLYVLWQAHRDVRRAQRYFDQARPALYLTSYSTYVQHGVAARVALRRGTRVVSFGNFQEFGKFLERDDPFHTRRATGYRADFESLPGKDGLLARAESQLELRLSGGIDSATSYMAASAYGGGVRDVPPVQGAVVVFLHDFYDSPHVYADLVFPDFWEWICFTIETLRSASIPFVIKPHPNQIALSDGVIVSLRERFPDMRLLPSGVSNRQLVDGGIACAVTVYGTVAHEMAFLGIPTIACARHPHIAFDFCRTARTREAYEGLLRESGRARSDTATLRAQALQFYVMHNLALSAEDIELRDATIAVWRLCHDRATPPATIVREFARLAALPGFSGFAQRMLTAAGIE